MRLGSLVPAAGCAAENARRVSHRRACGGHVGQHHGHGADPAARTQVDAAQHLRVGPEFDAIFQRRAGAAFAAVAKRDALPERAAGADRGGGVDEDAAEMPDAQARADPCLLGQADAGGRLDDPEQQPVQPGFDPASQAGRPPVDAAAEAVDPQRPERLLAQPFRPCAVAACEICLPVRIGHLGTSSVVAATRLPPTEEACAPWPL